MNPALSIITMVKFADGHWEEFAYPIASEANAFTHAVSLYHSTGICDPGNEWYADVVEIKHRPAMPSVN